jgi:uncharacterized protein
MANSEQGGKQEGKNGKSNRGFASMDKERQRAIASAGGRAAHQSGNAHEFTSEEARRAGRQSHASRRQSAQASSGSSGQDSNRSSDSGTDSGS